MKEGREQTELAKREDRMVRPTTPPAPHPLSVRAHKQEMSGRKRKERMKEAAKGSFLSSLAGLSLTFTLRPTCRAECAEMIRAGVFVVVVVLDWASAH